ncbi:MAG: hypothetical protein A2X86_00270 [Bdellovibrionales bacterium GWA2_49_15]|nr:MAG: hypothetical protein A2X86_00270 [Bdellovibrionales bacterium GWA2_49_15]HAZ14477.1 hypothetical protein [Bdellovibrionales bacterium]
MKRIIAVVAITLISSSAWSLAPLDSGTFSLRRPLAGKEFSASLRDYKRFADAYVSVTSDSDLTPCPGWSSFTKINSSYIDMCSVTAKLGYSVQVISQFRAGQVTDSRCLSKINYTLQIMTGTRPNLLPDNVRQVQSEFCLNPGGKTVTYNSYIDEGPHKGLLFPFIALEFKKLIPDLIKSVQALAQ